MDKKMAMKRKMGLETTVTRKIKQKLTDGQIGKRKALTVGTKKQRKQQMKNKQNDNHRDWAAGLPDYLLELVIERLSLVDCLSFSGVCKPWRSTTTEFFKGSTRVIPLLVKPWQSESITKTCINVFDKTNKNSTFDIPIPEEYIGSYVWGSYRDWLFLARLFEDQRQKYVHITLLNPFSGEKVVLPNTRDDYHMVVLSTVPSDPKCIYMLVGRQLGVAFWTSGARRGWRKCDDLMGSNRVVDALYHEGHFYLLKSTYEMVIIDEISVVNMLNNMSEGNDKSRLATQYLPLRAPCSEHAKKYIVESNGDLILVCRIFYKDSRSPLVGKTESFEKYRLDTCKMAWVKLESLGNNNKVVFLGTSCSRSFNTKEIGGGGGGDDALANKIYFSNNGFGNRLNEWDVMITFFIRMKPNGADDWGVFSLKKESRDWPRAFSEMAKTCAGIWVTAPILWCYRQMLLKRR